MRAARRHMPLVLGLMGVILMGVTSAWADITVSPTRLIFGSVTVGQSSQLPVTVSHTGSGSTYIGVSISGSGASAFSASPTSFKVPPSQTVVVTFSPTSAGTFTAVIHINAKTVTVTGKGVGGTPTPSGISSHNPYLPLLNGLR
jgi:P pilus assembly chaperone PapD